VSTEAATESRTELSKGYEHRDVEARWYRVWKERGYFHGDERDHTRPPFSIVLPPPNVTGSLHLGHALTATLQDVLTRWKRMSGFNALWLPGTDHAGIATQMIVEKEIQRTEHKTRHDLGRAEFLNRVWAWKEKFGSRIGEQHEALGASLDWARERFTMDEGLSRAVREVFVRLHEEGLVYRERKLINWCPRCRTALSDLEVTHEEAHQGELWSFAYPLSDGSGEVVVATTRPETMLGDTAVAVHPDDERYRGIVGKKVVHPLLNREIPVIADAVLVDPAFGTGAVKVTPAHDFNDFEVGRRHGLEMLSVIGPDGRMTAEAGPVAGLDRFEARKRVKQLLAEQGLDRGSKPHALPLGKCQRCETVLEPLLSQQWFVRIEPLARPAIEAVEQGRTRFFPEAWTNTYMAWMRNIHDWCISRQLWWGHQIPAWYCPDGHVTVARSAPEACATCGSRELRQDEDVLDTWFSSALWPFSTMGWPEQTETLRTFYPTSVMETGHDIIFFWVARMMMMGLHFMGDVPFRVVYLHPMVRDEKGQKMSKTKGNVIDPLVITEQYGADALRFTLAALTAQGRDIKLAKDRIEGYRAFANKLWNATRFALMNLAAFTVEGEGPRAADLSPADRWILARMQRAVNETIDALEGFHFNDAANVVYQFIWHELCDWYIELAKEALYADDLARKRSAQAVLTTCLETSLRLLHPIMPFVTEELWQTLQAQVGARWGESIMVARYPEKAAVDEAAERSFGPIIGIVDALRNIRGEMNIPFKVALRDVQVGSLSQEALATVQEEQARIVRLANVEGLAVGADPTRKVPGSAVGVGSGFEVRVPLAGVVNMAAEGARIEKELAKVDGDLGGIERKLATPSFVERAPKEVVEKDRARAEELREKRARLEAHRDMLAEASLAGPVPVDPPAAEATVPSAAEAPVPPAAEVPVPPTVEAPVLAPAAATAEDAAPAPGERKFRAPAKRAAQTARGKAKAAGGKGKKPTKAKAKAKGKAKPTAKAKPKGRAQPTVKAKPKGMAKPTAKANAKRRAKPTQAPPRSEPKSARKGTAATGPAARKRARPIAAARRPKRRRRS
jgi:valyl-tRNA synthetase